MNRAIFVGGCAIAALVAGSAFADIVMVDPSTIQGDNVLFGGSTQTGVDVFGTTTGPETVAFEGTSHGGNIIRANGGQARLEGALNTTTPQPNDTYTLDSLFFHLNGFDTFNNLEFNLFGGDATAATFTVVDNQGEVTTFSGNALGNGQNRFGFQGINGQSIRNFTISFTGGGVGDIRQIRLDEVIAVPEPATWALMIAGFGGAGALLRRRRQQTGAAAV